MRNLLHANLSRLKRDKIFWLCITALLIGSAGMVVRWCWEDFALGANRGLESHYFGLVLILGLFQAVFACLFLSVEYNEGTIRNKLAVGHTRLEIYWANFLTVLLASLLMVLAWAVGGLAGIPFVGLWRFGFGKLALYLLIVAAFSAAFSAIFTFTGVLITARSSTVVTVLVWIALVFAAVMIYNALSEPEFTSGMMVTVDGAPEIISEPNPRYVTGAVRAVYEFVYDLLPPGQAAQTQSAEVAHPVRALLCSAGITAATTGAGLALFQRKDLK